MFRKFYPKERINSTYQIDFEDWFQKGIRGFIFDIDNTLVMHGAPANEQAKQLFDQLRAIGLQFCLISNNQETRVKPFAQEVDAKFICNAHKPSKKNYEKAMEMMNTKADSTIFVGDQLFTDVYGANRARIYSILVNPIDKREEIQIVMKRKLESFVLFFYGKSKNS
jgi:uncharacterized protein